MKELDYSVLYRWFVGPSTDFAGHPPTVLLQTSYSPCSPGQIFLSLQLSPFHRGMNTTCDASLHQKPPTGGGS